MPPDACAVVAERLDTTQSAQNVGDGRARRLTPSGCAAVDDPGQPAM
jgi:hypothetical protein